MDLKIDRLNKHTPKIPNTRYLPDFQGIFLSQEGKKIVAKDNKDGIDSS